MSHFAKYFAIALASMSILPALEATKWSLPTKIPLPDGFPEVDFIFINEIQLTKDIWDDTQPLDYHNPLVHYLRIANKARQIDPHLNLGIRVVWEQLLFENSTSLGVIENIFDPQAPDYILKIVNHSYFAQKMAVGLKLKPFLFFKLNMALWDSEPVFISETEPDKCFPPSLCFYPSILWKNSIFNVDIGFGEQQRLFIDPQGPQFFQKMKTAATFFLNNTTYDNVFSFPIRVSFSVNFLAFGS